MREQMITVVDADGQTVGHYPVALEGDLTTREAFEQEALNCARKDGIPEDRLVGCSFKLVPVEKALPPTASS